MLDELYYMNQEWIVFQKWLVAGAGFEPATSWL